MARPYVPIEQAFWQRVDVGNSEECWNWIGAKRKDGYGQYRRREENVRAHRLALEVFGRPVSQDAMVHHTCGNRACVNPEHLVVMDWASHSRLHQGDTCKRGHPKTEVYVTPSGERSHCRICQRERARRQSV